MSIFKNYKLEATLFLSVVTLIIFLLIRKIMIAGANFDVVGFGRNMTALIFQYAISIWISLFGFRILMDSDIRVSNESDNMEWETKMLDTLSNKSANKFLVRTMVIAYVVPLAILVITIMIKKIL